MQETFSSNRIITVVFIAIEEFNKSKLRSVKKRRRKKAAYDIVK